MAYFKINNVDYSHCVCQLIVEENANYTARTNAAGDSVIDLINTKLKITVGIIPLSKPEMAELLTAIKDVSVNISFLNPKTGALLEGVQCMVANQSVEYYTIHNNEALFKRFTLEFVEL